MIVFIVFVLHAILLQFFEDWLFSQTGWLGFWMEMVYYVPCLIRDAIAYALGQYQSTSRIVLVLIGIECLLIALYLYGPALIQRLTTPKNHYTLLENTAYLDGKKQVAIGEDILKRRSKLANRPPDKKQMSVRYAMSMWININSHPNTRGEVIRVGSAHPLIYYRSPVYVKTANDQKSPDDKYGLVIAVSPQVTTENVVVLNDTQFPLQKWNLVVLNYTESGVDIFVNQQLMASVAWEKGQQVPTLSASDVFTLGEDGGLDGAIHRWMYYHEPLTLHDMVWIQKTYPKPATYFVSGV